jgi:hypothetical protein
VRFLSKSIVHANKHETQWRKNPVRSTLLSVYAQRVSSDVRAPHTETGAAAFREVEARWKTALGLITV